MEKDKSDTPVGRLREFVSWAQSNGFCKSESDFERICGLSPKYIPNLSANGKGNIGSEMLARIIRAFPQLNLVWIVSGVGSMLTASQSPESNLDYREAYFSAMNHIDVLNHLLNKGR